MNKLARRPRATLARPEQLTESARGYAKNVLAERSREAYASQWKGFKEWAEETGFASLPASESTVVLYLAARADQGIRPSGLNQALSAIGWAHVTAGFPSPARTEQVKAMLLGIRRTVGTATAKKSALLVPAIRAVVDRIPGDTVGLRDRALLLTGFAGGFRRSELADLNVEDLAEDQEGYVVRIQRSKTDQEGQGRALGIPYGENPETCPVRALRAWLERSRLTEGPLFRTVSRSGRLGKARITGRTVANVVKRRCLAAGMDPTQFSGHSLRRGLVTSAAKEGKSALSIAGQTGHKSMDVLRGYMSEVELFRNNAAKGIGL